MKLTFRKLSGVIIVTLTIAFSLIGCYETRYVHDNNHHTRGWYGHHRASPPAGVTLEVEGGRRR